MALTWAEMNEVKYSRYIGTIASAAPRTMAITGVWNLSPTFDSARGITLSKDHARRSLRMKTRLNHDQPMFPTKRPTTISHNSTLLGFRRVVKAVGTVDRGVPLPPFWIAQASMNGSPMTLSSI